MSKILSREGTVDIHPWKCASWKLWLLILATVYRLCRCSVVGVLQRRRTVETKKNAHRSRVQAMPRRRTGSKCSKLLRWFYFFLCVPAWVCVCEFASVSRAMLPFAVFVFSVTFAYGKQCKTVMQKVFWRPNLKPNTSIPTWYGINSDRDRNIERIHHRKTGSPFSFWPYWTTIDWPTLFGAGFCRVVIA